MYSIQSTNLIHILNPWILLNPLYSAIVHVFRVMYTVHTMYSGLLTTDPTGQLYVHTGPGVRQLRKREKELESRVSELETTLTDALDKLEDVNTVRGEFSDLVSEITTLEERVRKAEYDRRWALSGQRQAESVSRMLCEERDQAKKESSALRRKVNSMTHPADLERHIQKALAQVQREKDISARAARATRWRKRNGDNDFSMQRAYKKRVVNKNAPAQDASEYEVIVEHTGHTTDESDDDTTMKQA